MKKRIGIVGGGQLGRMLAMAAHTLGFTVTVLDPTAKSPAGQVADSQIVADFMDGQAIRTLASQADFLTFELEHVNTEVLKELTAEGKPVNPSPETLEIIKDKFRQKEFLKSTGIPTADFANADSVENVRRAGEKFGYPLLLKARTGGYDGRGNFCITKPEEIGAGFAKLGKAQCYVERWMPFTKELAVVVARGTTGEIVPYVPVETIHKNNICHMVIAPAPVSEAVRSEAQRVARRTLEQLKGVGVFGIEMFLLQTGEIFINEIAPRVHNSGHFSIEACLTSQFTQHIRAITGMPLESATMNVPAAVMVNILGDRTGPAAPAGIEDAEKIPGVRVHLYGKKETKPERKMGHVTAVGETVEEAKERATKARNFISI
jgi:phosphoribosylaminoimidazole carboxylase PurK protein